MSEANPSKEAADEEKLLGDASYKASSFDDAIGHYQDAWELYADVGYKNNEATNRYQKEDYHGAIAASKNGVENGEEETKTPAAVARAYSRIGMCYVAIGDLRKGVDWFERSVKENSAPQIVKKLDKLKKETDEDRDLGDKVAATVFESFEKLPKKRKPLEGGGKKEWVPLAGIVAQSGDEFHCISLGTGMKCLPFNKLKTAEGKVLHDWHAEVVALRSLNAFFLEEINKIRGEGKFMNSPQESEFLRSLTWVERKDTVGRWHKDTPDYKYTIKEGVKLHMYCSEAPCGDASMELTMASQEDATPWEVSADAAGGALPGRGGFGQLGIVRRKPSRPDAPECRSKSCSDKLAQKQMTSVLNAITSLAISPANAYLETFTLPESQYVHEAWVRCFSAGGRLKHIKELESPTGGYRFQPFKALTTSREFEYSRRCLGPDGCAPKPSNIACSWSPHHDETIIGGILQGCKLTTPPKDEAASVLSRYKMWQSLEADRRTSEAGTRDCTLAMDYNHIKVKKRSRARLLAKLTIRTVMMKEDWVKNEGDERWGRESQQALSKKKTQQLAIDATSDASDAIPDHAADITMAKERYPPKMFFPNKRKGKNGEDLYEFLYLGARGLSYQNPGSRSDHFDAPWLSLEEVKRMDPRGKAMAKYRKEESAFYKEVNSKEYKKHHARGEEMLRTGEWIDYEAASSESEEEDDGDENFDWEERERKHLEGLRIEREQYYPTQPTEQDLDLDAKFPPKILASCFDRYGNVEYQVRFACRARGAPAGGEPIFENEWIPAAEMPHSGDARLFHAHNPTQPRPRPAPQRKEKGAQWTPADQTEYETFLMMGTEGMTLQGWMNMSTEDKDELFLAQEREMVALEESFAREKALKQTRMANVEKAGKKAAEGDSATAKSQSALSAEKAKSQPEEKLAGAIAAAPNAPSPKSTPKSARRRLRREPDSSDDMHSAETRKMDLLRQFPPTIRKARVDADGDLEYKVEYVARIDKKRDEAQVESEWMMADDIKGVDVYEAAVRAFQEGEGGVDVQKDIGKYGTEGTPQSVYANGMPKIELETWLSMSARERAELAEAEKRMTAQLPALEGRVALEREAEKEAKKRAVKEGLAEMQRELMAGAEGGKGMDTLEGRQKAEAMMRRVLQAGGMTDQRMVDTAIRTLSQPANELN